MAKYLKIKMSSAKKAKKKKKNSQSNTIHVYLQYASISALAKRHTDFSKKIQIVSFFLTVLFWFLKEVSNSILSTVLFLCPVTPFILASDYCDSVLCLVGQGVQFDDVSLMELEDVLEQKLLERWNSCGSAGIL